MKRQWGTAVPGQAQRAPAKSADPLLEQLLALLTALSAVLLGAAKEVGELGVAVPREVCTPSETGP
ncbi:MAG: hypothetical protein K0R41_296 [Geminicoccaceae bacterium]|nr:hypothetical protein [Geminicoccaceae bacterium]